MFRVSRHQKVEGIELYTPQLLYAVSMVVDDPPFMGVVTEYLDVAY